MPRRRVALLLLLLAGPAYAARHDFQHTRVVAQETQHPVPLFVVYTGPAAIIRASVRYRTRAMADWASLDLHRHGAGWAAVIPCDDLVRGELLYYFNGFDEMGDIVATGGDRTEPYRTAIRPDHLVDPPHLPGEPPPSVCIGASDCPPGFPGCTPEPLVRGKEGGELCDESAECASGVCTNDVCRDVWEPKHGGRRFWLGLDGAFGLDVLPGQFDVCTPGTPAWYCDPPSTSPLLSTSTSHSDQVHRGVAPGNVRVLASFDHALTGNWLVGARVGGVLRTYPGAAGFPPFHLEARTSYVFGDHPIFNAGLAPYVAFAFGLGPYEASSPAVVVDGTTPRNVDAWHPRGPGLRRRRRRLPPRRDLARGTDPRRTRRLRVRRCVRSERGPGAGSSGGVLKRFFSRRQRIT